mgnify:CR=1 FL=1
MKLIDRTAMMIVIPGGAIVGYIWLRGRAERWVK